MKASRLIPLVIAWLLVGPSASAATITGTTGIDVLFGTNDPDEIDGDGGNDVIFAKGGDDDVSVGAASIGASAWLGSGSDRFVGAADAQTAFDDDGPGPGDGDFIQLRGGSDSVYSADGDADRIECGRGTDTVFADAKDVVLDCETVISENGPAFDGDANVKFGTGKGQTINGTEGLDFLFGKGGADTINGRGGIDFIFGGAGEDLLLGGAGGDRLTDDDGTAGDVLRGGAGIDVFYAADGARGTVDCGDDEDHAFVDRDDKVVDCENVYKRPRFDI